MARRYDPTRVLVAQVIGAARRGVTPAELVEIARGRADVLELALVRAPSEWDRPGEYDAADALVRAALALVRSRPS